MYNLCFVVLFAALLVGVAAALTAVLVVGKTEIHQDLRTYRQHTVYGKERAGNQNLLCRRIMQS
jgi:hypothetical protein